MNDLSAPVSVASTSAETVAARLAAVDDAELVVLGLHDDDRADVLRVIRLALADSECVAEIATLADALRGVIGTQNGYSALESPLAKSEWEGIGVLPMLALIAVADDVREFHRSRGVPPEISRRSLTDLGQQAWVHRRTYGAFGLHTYTWMTQAYSGNLYWLGRLQFNISTFDDELVLSTHIPESGPLTPDAVRDSFEQAAPFFAEHFPDFPTRLFHCGSWLLDPQLVEVLKPESNMVKFQQLWQLSGEPRPGDADAIFFVFRKRSGVDRSTLPRDTSLQRAVLDKLDAGGHWYVRQGTIPQSAYAANAIDEEERA